MKGEGSESMLALVNNNVTPGASPRYSCMGPLNQSGM